jgi:hypothetical protein
VRLKRHRGAAEPIRVRIIEDSPATLRLRDRTLWISVLSSAAAAFLVYRVVAHRAHPNNYYSAAFLAVFGFAFLGMADVEFDKVRRVCTLRILKLVRLTRASLPFDSISDVRVEIAPSVGTSNATTCRLSLVTTSGVMPLTTSYEPTFERYERMRETILGALGRTEMQGLPTDPVEALVHAGRIVDAVSLLRKRENLDLVTARDRVAALQQRTTRG